MQCSFRRREEIAPIVQRLCAKREKISQDNLLVTEAETTMTAIPVAKPEDIGVVPARWRRAGELLRMDRLRQGARRAVRRAQGPHAGAILVGKQRPTPTRRSAKMRSFWIAVHHQAVTATAVMMLVERGWCGWKIPVAEHVRSSRPRARRTCWSAPADAHSGCPTWCRQRRPPRRPQAAVAFVDATCDLELLFPRARRSTTRAWAF